MKKQKEQVKKTWIFSNRLFSLPSVLLIFILLFAAFLRLYHLRYVVGFEFDQEYAAQFANTILTVYPIQMIGQGLSVQGLFMGPAYFYYLVPFFFLTHLDPIGGYLGSITLGLIIIAVYYFICKQIFDTKTALLIAFFRAFLYGALVVDWTMAPSYSSELAIILTWFFLYTFWHGNRLVILPIAFLAGLYTSFHPVLFPFYVVILVILIIRRKFFSFKLFPIAIVLFILPMISLIAFEYFRHFLEVKTLLSLSHTSRSETKNLTTFIEYVKVVFYFPYAYMHLPDNDILRNIISLFIFISTAYCAVKKVSFWQDAFHRVIFFATPVIIILYYFFLPVHAPDYYFLAAEIIYFLYVVATAGILLRTPNGRVLVTIVLAYILFLNLLFLSFIWRSPAAALGNKEDAVRYIVQREGNNQYDVIYDVGQGWQFGYGYLFRYYTTLYHIQPNNKPAKDTYTIVINDATYHKGTLKYTSGNIRVFEMQNK